VRGCCGGSGCFQFFLFFIGLAILPVFSIFCRNAGSFWKFRKAGKVYGTLMAGYPANQKYRYIPARKKTEIKYIAAELYVKGENYASEQLCYRVETGR
jgi:NADH:ubiquinone oxidoreductase subunit H